MARVNLNLVVVLQGCGGSGYGINGVHGGGAGGGGGGGETMVV